MYYCPEIFPEHDLAPKLGFLRPRETNVKMTPRYFLVMKYWCAYVLGQITWSTLTWLLIFLPYRRTSFLPRSKSFTRTQFHSVVLFSPLDVIRFILQYEKWARNQFWIYLISARSWISIPSLYRNERSKSQEINRCFFPLLLTAPLPLC